MNRAVIALAGRVVAELRGRDPRRNVRCTIAAGVEASGDARLLQVVLENLIGNGATLQIGIGAIPNIVAQLLAAGKKGDFGIHTEMMVDGIMWLHKAGKVTSMHHYGLRDGHVVAFQSRITPTPGRELTFLQQLLNATPGAPINGAGGINGGERNPGGGNGGP